MPKSITNICCLQKETTIKGKMNTEVGVIEVKILNCIHKGKRPKTALSELEDSTQSFHSVNKSVGTNFLFLLISKNKNICNINSYGLFWF